MNNLIKTFATLLLLCVATITFAQSKDYVRSFTSIKFLTEKLDLSDEQTKSVQALLDEQDTQLKALRNGDTDRNKLLPAVNDIRSNTNDAIKSLLTAEQLEIFDQLISQRKLKRDVSDKRESFMGPGNLIKKLNLTESQTSAYNLIMREQAQQIKAARESLEADENRSALSSKILEIRKATQEKIKKILNEEQLALYNELLNKSANRFKQNQGQKVTPND